MTLRNVRLVYAKEMRDTLRDRRTLFISVILPILLYPLLMIGLSQVVMTAQSRIEGREQKVAVTGSGIAAIVARLKGDGGVGGPGLEVVPCRDPEDAIRKGTVHLWVEVLPEFSEAIASGRQGRIRLHYDSTRDDSRAAELKAVKALRSYGEEVLRSRGLSEAEIEPVKMEAADAATKGQRGAKQFGPPLALLVVIMALSGAFYPAIDIMAGEKERGTMETLLVCPATRTEIVVGKYLTVLTMTLVAALLNFASMAVTFAHFASYVPARGGSMALEISPVVAGIILLALLPLAGLFSAVALALSTFARTYKEGQHYLTPLFLAVMPLALVAIVPGTKLASFGLVPVAGVVLLVRDLLLGAAGPGSVLVVLVSTTAFAALAILWTVAMFNKEDVLFRDPGGTDFSLLKRATERGQVPRAGQALGLAATALVLLYFFGPRLGALGGVAAAFLFQQVGLTLLLPLAAIAWYRLDFRKTLSLAKPPASAWPAVLVGAPSVLVLLLVLVRVLGLSEALPRGYEKAFEDLFRTIPLPVFLLLPPIAEEVFFRGFILAGFRSRGKAWVAVVATAALFAVFHLSPAKYLPTGLAGLWLAYVVVATGSLYPAILAHLIHNGLPFLLDAAGWNGEVPLWAALPAAAGLAVALRLLERARRRGGAGDAGESLPPAAPPGSMDPATKAGL